jgi:hypothetical protein
VAHCYGAFNDLVSSRSPILGLNYLKTKVRRVISNLVTRLHARVRVQLKGGWGGNARIRAATTRVVGEAVRVCWGGALAYGDRS